MQCLHLITVCDSYQPLAGTGHNTIRKFAGKYGGVHVGDNIVMHYVNDPATQDPAFATDFLVLSAMALAPLDAIIKHHGRKNQAYAEHKTLAKLEEHILSCYPLAEGEERNPADLYCTLYF